MAKKQCAFRGCKNLSHAHGLCISHYSQKKKGRALTKIPERQEKHVRCSAEGCRRENHGRFCRMHWGQFRAYGRIVSVERRKGCREVGEVWKARGQMWIKIADRTNAEIYGRFVMATAIGRPLKRTERVFHRDGNPLNCDIDNLEIVQTRQIWVSCSVCGEGFPKQASQHHRKVPRCEKCNVVRNEKHYNAKLKGSDIPKIAKLAKAGMRLRDIAKKFGVNFSTIQRITSGNSAWTEKIDLPKRHTSDEVVKRAAMLIANGKTDGQIAKALSVTRGAVANWRCGTCRKEITGGRAIVQRNCVQCGNYFAISRKHRTMCSVECRLEARKIRKRIKK